MEIGAKVKSLRKSLGLTQKELAERCGYKSLTTINKIELGINSIPLNTIEKLASALEVSPAYLMGWTDNYNDNIDKENQELYNLIQQLTDDEVKELSSFVDYLISKRKN